MHRPDPIQDTQWLDIGAVTIDVQETTALWAT